MPLRKGSSPAIISQNIREFHTGKTYAHTAAKFGSEKARKQAIAVAYATARRSGKQEGGAVNDFPTIENERRRRVQNLAKLHQLRPTEDIDRDIWQDEREIPPSPAQQDPDYNLGWEGHASRGGRFADGGDVDDPDLDPNSPIPKVTVRPRANTEQVQAQPEYSDEALARFGQRADTGRAEPRWMAPSQSTYRKAAQGVDTAEQPQHQPGNESFSDWLAARDDAPRLPSPHADEGHPGFPVSKYTEGLLGLRGRERVHTLPEQLFVDPARKIQALEQSGAPIIDPATGEPDPRYTETSWDIAQNLAGGVRTAAALHPNLIPKGALGMHGSNFDWTQFEKELSAVHGYGDSSGPLPSMNQHAGSWIDSSKFEKISDAKGSNPGGTYRDPNTDQRWYIKRPPTEDHIKNEILANKLYQLAGVPVPDLRHTTIKIGDKNYPAVASPIVPGQPLNKFPLGDIGEMYDLRDNFPVDAWLANWDAVGTGKDNVIVNPITMEAHRIDMGGALRYRAQGAPKGEAFGNDVPELKTMLDPKKSPDAAQVFQGAHDAEVGGDAAQRIADIKPSDLAKAINEWGPGTINDKSDLYDKLMMRRKAVVDYYKSIPEPASTSPGNQIYESAQTGQFADKPVPVTVDQIYKTLSNETVPYNIAVALKAYAKTGNVDAAVQAKLKLPLAQKKAVNKTLWAMKNSATTPEEAELLGQLFADKKFPTPPANVSKAETPKAIKDYDKEVGEYYHALDEQDNHQYELAQGPDIAAAYPKENLNAPKPDSLITHKEFSKLTQEQLYDRFSHQIGMVPKWTEWKPDYKSYSIPKLSKINPGFAKLLGFNTEVTFYKGGESQFSGHFIDPAKKASEPGFFLSDNEDTARAYSKSSNTPIDRYVVRASKSGEIDWRKFTGLHDWSPSEMTKLLHQARKDNLDMLIIKNIADVGGGNQTQYVLLHTNGTIRSVDANFNPLKIGHGHSHWAIPAGIAGTGLTAGAAQDEDQPMIKRAQGGNTPFHLRGYNESIGAPTSGAEPGVRHFTAPHSGMIHSQVPGRTDKISMNVKGGSYVLPASIVSGMGQGNSQAGSAILNSFFKMGPYGAATKGIGAPKVNYGKSMSPRMPSAPTPKMPKFAAGGTNEGHEKIPIVAAGGEFIISPEVVRRLGGGSMKKGHDVLDEFVKHMRKKTIQDMKNERPPKK